MTVKQQNILETALELFAINGYDGTTTKEIASKASVSEGLIFKHFMNKQGVLDALLIQGKSEIQNATSTLNEISDPKEKIKAILTFPFQLEKEQQKFWRLMYAIKWQREIYDHSVSAPIKNLLLKAFIELNSPKPEAETEVVLLLLDGLSTSILLRKPKNLEHIKEALINRYDI